MNPLELHDANDLSPNKNYVLHEFDKNMQNVLENGLKLEDRTGVGCKFLPGVLSTIDISQRVPVPTRRETNWKSMLKEYLWFISGSNNIKDLNALGSKVWDFWRDDEWALKNGFEEGSIGYGYGTNLIHFGCDLNDMEKNPGFNQLDYVINELKNNRNSRRIQFNFYRPDKSGKNDTRLPACHNQYQFIVEPDENGNLTKLSCCMTQRSCDAFIGGLSTNLQGTAFIVYMLAQQCDLTPSKIYHFSGNFHVYNNHVEALKEYLGRGVPNSPILKLSKKNSIYEYTADDFVLEDYKPFSKIKVEVAV
jgi:thymidylate synthase